LPGIPKPMAEVAGRPFLEWVVRYLAKQRVSSIVLSTGYLGDVVKRHFDSQPVAGVTVRCAREAQPLGTAGGFLHAVRASGVNPAAWLVLNGDSLCFANLSLLAAELAAPGVVGVLTGCAVQDASRYGTLVTGQDHELLGFEEKRPGSGVINAGMYLFRHSALEQFPARNPLSFELDVFPALAERHVSLRVFVAPGPFLDIGTPESLQQAETFIQSNMSQFAE